MVDTERGYWAAAVCNKAYFFIDTFSGYAGGTHRDYKGAHYVLQINVKNQELGAAAIDAMALSRFVLARKREGVLYDPEIEFDIELYDYEKSEQRYKDWLKDTMERYGYKTKSKIFDGMKRCSLGMVRNLITIRPSHHMRSDSWDNYGLTEEDNVIIPATSTAEEVGAALRLAFSRCT